MLHCVMHNNIMLQNKNISTDGEVMSKITVASFGGHGVFTRTSVKFHHDRIWNDGPLGFLEEVAQKEEAQEQDE